VIVAARGRCTRRRRRPGRRFSQTAPDLVVADLERLDVRCDPTPRVVSRRGR